MDARDYPTDEQAENLDRQTSSAADNVPSQQATAEAQGKPALAERESEDGVSLLLKETSETHDQAIKDNETHYTDFSSQAPVALSYSPPADKDENPIDDSAPNAAPAVPRPDTLNTVAKDYDVWKSETEVSAAAHTFIWMMIGAAIIFVSVSGLNLLKLQLPADGLEQMNLPAALGLQHVPSMDQVLIFLPAAVIACALTSYAVAWVAARSRSRQIDWTDSHLILEYSGPLALTFKWSAITSVDQQWQWELFHGRQPVFVIKTQEENQFKLRLSDISHKHNIGEFFSLIKTNAPSATLNVERSFAADNSYTELWLKYFSTPAEREKTGLLEEGMVLDNGRYKIVGTIGGGGQGTAYCAEINHEMPPATYDVEQSIEQHYGAEQRDRAEQNGDDDAESHGEISQKRDLAQAKHIMRADTLSLAKLKHAVLKEYILPIHRGHLTAERTADKLKMEAKILQRLQHPQIVGLLDAFIEDYRGYLVLDYVAGESLKSIVDRTGPLPESTVIDWAIQICAILRYLHGLTPPVVHRDITPDNLLLQDDGRIKVVDFNVAYQVDSSATATVVGKHAYIPAEQFRGKPTPQSDIYALGGTMFYLLTGKEPEPISESHPRAMNDQLSEELDTVIGKATAHNLADRYRDVDELSIALRALIK